MIFKQTITILFLAVIFFSCQKKDTPIIENLPTVDTVITGTVIFKEPAHTFGGGNISVTVARSCPCYPSNEIYFFTANTPNITDTVNTTYTWTVKMTTDFVLTGKKVQFVFPRAGGWRVNLEVKTNGVLVDSMHVDVIPFGQQANNKNVSIHADCIDSNRKNFISFYSTHTAPTDGSVNAIYWDFDDGTHYDSQYVQHEFPKLAYDKYYYVKLFISNTSGCKDSAMQKVFVLGYYNNLPCKFTWSQTSACKPYNEVFTFVADTLGVPNGATYVWDFKDYVIDFSGQKVTHEFTYPNRYDVTMKIMYQGRELCSHYDTNVRAKGQNVTPIAYYYSSVEQDTLDTVRQFFNCQSKFDNGGFLEDIIWYYGDGTFEHRSQYDYNSRHTYHKQVADKTYHTKMVIVANSGCRDTSYFDIVIPKL
jgi:PKD domain